MKAILAAALAALCTPIAAQAAIVINVQQVGTSVVLKGSGTFDTSGLTLYAANLQGSPRINPAFGSISVGISAPINMFTGITGPGLGYLQRSQLASSATGDVFGIAQYMGAINLPVGYQSGSLLSGSATYLDATIASLGLKDGQYVFRSSNDSLTVNIGGSAVPEPAMWGMMIGGFVFAGGTLRRRSGRAMLRAA
ncbi:PEPxxWA-CTERM sorting domain-containing protein [Sphingomonas trueperi]|uniref:PEPxxWA-CTERM sorting domain-containing protein n=1 Tax=Sphingomonas trueperi TaxID=53317 RepID=UPI0011C47839